MKRYVITICSLFALSNELNAVQKVTNHIRFLIHNKSFDSKSEDRVYTVTMQFLHKDASLKSNDDLAFLIPELNPRNPFFVPYVAFTFDFLKVQEYLKAPDKNHKQALQGLTRYIETECIDQIVNRDETQRQIDILLDMFASENDFTKPYHELYQKIKEFCAQVGIEVIEPQQLTLWQRLLGRS